MVKITIDLLRKRAEHNDGCLTNLVEIALHQQDIEKIEVVGDECRMLEILLMQNNLITRIENLGHLKRLRYLNLAINCIKHIEGVSQLESLEKLDLTLNFISDITNIGDELRELLHFKSLYLVGNPVANVEGYRQFVAIELPQVKELDGVAITRSERIGAAQGAQQFRATMLRLREQFEQSEAERLAKIARGEVEAPKYNEQGERLYGNTAEDRIACANEIAAAKAPPAKPTDGTYSEPVKPPPLRSPEEEIAKFGRVLLRNESRIKFLLWDADTDLCPEQYNERFADAQGKVFLHFEPGKYIATQLIQINAHPTFVRVTIKDKVLQLVFPSEVAISEVSVERSKLNGNVLMILPKSAAFITATREKEPPSGEPVPNPKKGVALSERTPLTAAERLKPLHRSERMLQAGGTDEFVIAPSEKPRRITPEAVHGSESTLEVLD